MTKERRLAIEMWKDIRGMISASDRLSREVIKKYKSEFCIQHNLSWANDCWFCEYTPGCSKCPLRGCADSYYDRALDETRDKKVRVEACNFIIKALGGKV